MATPTGMIGAAKDLGLNSMDPSLDQAAQEELRKKRLQQQQQANGNAVAPYTGAYLSLSGNQF